MNPILVSYAACQRSETPTRMRQVALITDLFIGSGVIILGLVLKTHLSGLCVGGGATLAAASTVLHLVRRPQKVVQMEEVPVEEVPVEEVPVEVRPKKNPSDEYSPHNVVGPTPVRTRQGRDARRQLRGSGFLTPSDSE